MTPVADTHLSILSAKLVCPYANLGLYNGLNWFLHTTASWNNPENVSRLELYQVFSFFVVLMSLSTLTQSFGLRRFAVVGSNVFVLLLLRRWTGLESSPWVGVFLCDKSERYGSVPAFFAFFMKVFAALTAIYHSQQLFFDLSVISLTLQCTTSKRNGLSLPEKGGS